MAEPPSHSSPLEIFLIYLRLGCLSFGGPVAHMAYFQEEFVRHRGWLNDARYAELIGLCQFVPGPSSSQLGFAIALHRGGLTGACAAWLGFTLPSALLMCGLAYGLFALSGSITPLTDGLLIAAVAVVANATIGLGIKLCPDLPRLAIALLAAACMLNFPSGMTQIAVILMGAFLGQYLQKATHEKPPSPLKHSHSTPRAIIVIVLALYAVLLVVSLLVEAATPGALYAMHYRAGALVFGGGHVVLPLLNESVVAGGLISESNFLAGYSAAQALPGPLFALSAFLGTVGSETSPAAIGGLLALIAIFLPGMLLLIGLLPFWAHIRSTHWAQSGLTGANAAVVGLLLAALIDPVWTHGIQSSNHLGIALIAFFALYKFKVPAWAVVLGCAALGVLPLPS